MELWRTIRTKVRAHDVCVCVSMCKNSSAELTSSAGDVLKKLRVLFLCVCFSQEAGWGCCHGDATPEECRGRGGRGQREEEDQHSKEREERVAGQAHQTGCSDWQSRQELLFLNLAGFLLF